MDQQVDRLYKKTRAGKAVLFLGAGASMGTGIPNGIELAHRLQKEFNINLSSDDLIETCTQVLDTPGINRSDVEDYIRLQLDKQPLDAHKKLPLNQWQAIFTTNFDDLVETAYRSFTARKQRCEPVFSSDFSRRQSDYVDLVRLFKLMGCVSGHAGDSQMVLSRSDYNRKLRRRGSLLRLLYDFVKDGTIIYAGYSFRDQIARDILDEVIDEVGIDRLPWGWALMPEWDDGIEQFLRQRKVIPLKITFEDFLDNLLAAARDKEDDQSFRNVSITVSGFPIDIAEYDFKMYSREFQVLHDEIGQDTTPDSVSAKRDYLEGKIDLWIGITREWAFNRPVCQQIEKLVLKQLDGSSNEFRIPIVLVQGPAGAGKSTVVRSVAYNIYRNFGFPTILLHVENDEIDYKVIDTFSRHIEESLPVDVRIKRRPPTVIVVDEAAAHIQDIRRLPQYLKSRGIPALILAVARENEWEAAQGEHPISTTAKIRVSDLLDITAGEPNDLITHLRKLGVLVSSQDNKYWQMRIAREYENSFATTLYQLAEPTRPPLNKAIIDEYVKLSPLAKQAYQFVCVFYQYSIPLDLELLARSLGHSYEHFIDAVYDSATRGVIIEEPSEYDDIRFRARSRLIAERVVLEVFSTETAWLTDVCTVIKACLPNNSNEVKTIRNMLIRRIGPRGAEPKDFLLVKEAFQAALDAGIRDSTTLHHFALLLADQEAFDDAERYALEALAVLDDDQVLAHFKTESRQNLNNTLGMILAKRAIKENILGNEVHATELFERAVTYFRAARSGEFSNAYPYYSEAWMFYQRARSSVGTNAIKYIAQAFQVLDDAEGNVADDDIAPIKEMEAKLVRFLSDFNNLNTLFEQLRSQDGPTVAYLKARYASTDENDKYSKERAYAIITDSIQKAPNHVPSLRLAAYLHHKIFPDDFLEWKNLLDRLYSFEETPRQCSTLFNLGYANCQIGNYNEAMRYFEELELESTGHPKRSYIVEIVREGEKERRLIGHVIDVSSSTGGWLRSEVIAKSVKFIPRAQKFTVQKGQSVTFSLALNYRGTLAINLRPL